MTQEAVQMTETSTDINVTDEQISGQAIGYLLMPDFDIVPPSIAGVLQAEELVTVKFEFVAISEKG